MKCCQQTEVYSRIVGYFRPVQNWNIGKKQEFADRKEYLLAVGKSKEGLLAEAVVRT